MGQSLKCKVGLRFEFFPLRFEFTAREPLFFPPGKAANTLRGALGLSFKRIACTPECQVTRTWPNSSPGSKPPVGPESAANPSGAKEKSRWHTLH
jgi:hypothetical protein